MVGKNEAALAVSAQTIVIFPFKVHVHVMIISSCLVNTYNLLITFIGLLHLPMVTKLIEKA